MTTLSAATIAFETAFNIWLEQTSPNVLTSTKEAFKHLPSKSRDDKPILERIGKARLFSLETQKPEWVRHDYFGSVTQGVTFDYDLIIAYPAANRWHAAMIDDHLLIKCKMVSSPIVVAGVGLAQILDTFERIETEDKWVFTKCKVRVLYDVTAS